MISIIMKISYFISLFLFPFCSAPLFSQQNQYFGIVDMTVESIKTLNTHRSLVEEAIVLGDTHISYFDYSVLESTPIKLNYIFTDNRLKSISVTTETIITIDEANLLLGKYFIELIGIFKSNPSISAPFINYQEKNTTNSLFEDDPNDNFFIPPVDHEIPPAVEYRWIKESKGRLVFAVLNLSYISANYGLINLSIWKSY